MDILCWDFQFSLWDKESSYRGFLSTIEIHAGWACRLHWSTRGPEETFGHWLWPFGCHRNRLMGKRTGKTHQTCTGRHGLDSLTGPGRKGVAHGGSPADFTNGSVDSLGTLAGFGRQLGLQSPPPILSFFKEGKQKWVFCDTDDSWASVTQRKKKNPLDGNALTCCEPVTATDCPFGWFWPGTGESYLVALPCWVPALSGTTLMPSSLGDTGTAPGLADTCILGERSPKCCSVKFTMAELGVWPGTGWLAARAGLFPTGTAATEVGETINFKGVTWKEGKLTAVSSDDVTGITPGKTRGENILKAQAFVGEAYKA